jgi:hypothetical protein
MDLLFGLALSAHLGLTDEYNEIHPHIRLENDRVATGIYYNSLDELSVYLGLKYQPLEKINLETGIVSGYDSIAPLIPYARIIYQLDDNTSLFLTPTAEKHKNNLNTGVVIGFEFMFDK